MTLIEQQHEQGLALPCAAIALNLHTSLLCWGFDAVNS